MRKLSKQYLLQALLLAGMSLGNAAAVGAQEFPMNEDEQEAPFDRAGFLELITGGAPPDMNILKKYYQRPKYIPLRNPHWIKNAEAMRVLGKKIFFDPRLSHSGLMSCSTCHNPTLGWTDGLPRSPENEFRRSMSLYNIAWDKAFLWNARAGSLMAQSALAISAKKGMDLDLTEVARKLNSIPGYQIYFSKAFDLSANEAEPATLARTAAAIEVFVSTIISSPSAFDRWIAGDEHAISERAKRGFLLFNGQAKCAQCHNSWRFSDGQIYNTGMTSQCEDSKKERSRTSWNNGMFKAVGLRSISTRGPYMHDGSLTSLRQVVEFYNRGGDAQCDSTSPHVQALGLSSSQVEDVVQFLHSLEDSKREYVLPELPR